MKTGDLFGLNSWLIDEFRKSFFSEANNANGLSGQDKDWALQKIIGRLFTDWMLDQGYRVARLAPLSSVAKYFRSDTDSCVIEDFLKFCGLQDTSITSSSISFLEQRLQEFKKSYCVRVSCKETHERRYFYETLYSPGIMEPGIEELKKVFLESCIRAELLEDFLHKRFVGSKRFSIEGIESFIGAIQVIKHKAAYKFDRIALGMAHRGRLSTLAIWGNLPLETIVNAFSNKLRVSNSLCGDVKYHWGYTSISHVGSQVLYLDILPNPSHLEAVNPVLFGYLRGLKSRGFNPLGILAHGNSAFCGQGVNQELLNFSGCEGFEKPPVVHFILDNLVGFTATPREEKKTLFASDLFLSYQVPVILVNGLDYDAVLTSVLCAFDYCQRFGKDCAIHLFGYRRHGHNEADDPTVTQPVMYSEIKGLELPGKRYLRLWNCGILLKDEPKLDVKENIETDLPTLQTNIRKETNPLRLDADFFAEVRNTIEGNLGRVKLHPKVKELYERRLGALGNHGLIDWGLGEIIAFCFAMKNGYNIRLVGEDSKRGTFSHRHICVWDIESEESVCVLENFSNLRIEALNSALSEYASLGFESGVSLGDPSTLCFWEAQFGDFVNGAQIMIDQFLSCSFEKWGIYFPITLLLPHGQEGAGPEHSSARIERFLQLSANNNWVLVQPVDVMSYFGFLTQQIYSSKPLIIFTPKSLLRVKETYCKASELVDSNYRSYKLISRGGDKLLVCSGKIFYNLLQISKQDILCIQQIFPVDPEIEKILARYHKVVFVQEEFANQGLWPWFMRTFQRKDLDVVAPEDSNVTAVGLEYLFLEQQKKLFERITKI
ncbi:MAG: thiamine pyrophosphate-dependent enzyme [Deltaproteobacteria bacterium]|nr:thiamine pyrophosphate-dependent enzyme [Deltaproteobacteria bacterium]